MNDVVINKVASIQRCIQRARQEYNSDREGFLTNFTVQDAAILNVLRACEQSIDLANHFVKKQKLGIPAGSAETFELLAAARIINPALGARLKKMVSFRNTVTHQYQQLNLKIVEAVINTGLDDLLELCDLILAG